MEILGGEELRGAELIGVVSELHRSYIGVTSELDRSCIMLYLCTEISSRTISYVLCIVACPAVSAGVGSVEFSPPPDISGGMMDVIRMSGPVSESCFRALAVSRSCGYMRAVGEREGDNPAKNTPRNLTIGSSNC